MVPDNTGSVSVIDFRRQRVVLQWHVLGGTWTACDLPPALVHGIALIRPSQPNICIYGHGGRLRLQVGPEQEKILRSADCCGGSVIVAPNSRIIAGPMGAEEGILYADCDLDLAIQMKLRHDFAGHYNRPDIFQLHVNRAAPNIYRVHNAGQDALPGAGGGGMLGGPGALLPSPEGE